jgi:ABC-type dipeptide/oligopeptide/nickel transport system permease subunit
VISVLIAGMIGVPAGLLAGFARGWTDAILSRIVDAMLAIPFLILALALVMLNAAQQFLTQAPWLAVFPGLMIILVVLGFNLTGDALHDALDAHRGK